MNPNSRHGTLMKPSLRNAVHQLKRNAIEQPLDRHGGDGRTGGGEALAFEYVTQMPATCCTSDFNATHTQSVIFMSVHGSRYR